MPNCPECQIELEDDFGIVDCKSCGAICSVDLDGEVQIQGDIEKSSEEEVVAESSEESVEVELAESEDESPYEEENPVEEVEEYEASEDEHLEEDEAVEEAPALKNSLSPMLGSEFLRNLEFFTEESSSEELGHVYYDLHVMGFESNEEKENLIETLADERLEITEEYLRELIGEENMFILPQISFLRLSIIYKRLLPLNLSLNWTLSDEQGPRQVESSLDEEEYPEEYAEDDLS